MSASLTVILASVAYIVGRHVYEKYWEPQAAKERKTEKVIREAGVLEEQTLTPEQAVQGLKFLGLPSVHAGDVIVKVPSYDPLKEAEWSSEREVLTTTRAVCYTNSGIDPMDIVELSGRYILAACAGSGFIFSKLDLTTGAEDDLNRERTEVLTSVKNVDNVIENFQGQRWSIKGAYGENVQQKPGEQAHSYIQALSVHPKLGTEGYLSILPPKILDGEMHRYADMRAKSEDGEILFFFHAGSKLNAYIGRKLEGTEIARMQVI